MSAIRRITFVLFLAPSCHTVPATQVQDQVLKVLPFMDLTASIVDSKEVMAGLKQRGFNVDPKPVFHPKQHVCEFIYLGKPNLQAMVLEICHIDASRPKDNAEQQEETPGIEFNLRVDENLQGYFEGKKAQWAAFEPSITHKNYDWGINSKDRLPGWNFLEFAKPPIQGINFVFVEREKNVQVPVDQSVRQSLYSLRYQPNGVQMFLGVLMVSTQPGEREAFESISRAQRRGDCSYLPDGTWVQWLKPDAALAKNFPDKLYPLRAVVLGGNAKTFAETAKPDDTIDFNGRPAARLRLVKAAWDILLVKTSQIDDMTPPAGPCS